MTFTESMAAIKKTFKEVDRNNDGFLDSSEVKVFFTKYYSMTEKQLACEQLEKKVSDFMTKLTRNGSSRISLDDFCDYFLEYRRSFD